ncbi:MAG: IS66 family transposase [Phaeodactylibacter xiamenensis]|uniref:IS66 family transposase n=2 Tax=Phaeodactylibacter xiamenensis TaxID=1524460 RepID=UPI0006969559|nr:IS66 family transposase [Phaeodactylibacter xiamenensis]
MNKDEIIAQQAEQIAKLESLLEAALARIAELEAQLKANSRTSSRPPSSDGLKKAPAFPRKKGGKKGGQSGHKGKTLEMVAPSAADRLVVHPVAEQKCSCGQNLESTVPSISLERRQVFDLPPKLLQIEEHRLEVKHCPCCGEQHTGSFPSGVPAPVQYGDRVHALVSLLNVEQSMPVGRIGELFASLTGYELNENTVSTSVQRMYGKLADDEAVIKEQALSSPVAHADESGARVAGKLHWAHNFVCGLFTYLFVHEKRGAQALHSDESIAQNYTGTLVHDCWASYFGLENARHALCGAHLLRELRGLAENHERQWADKMHSLLMYAYEFSSGGSSVLPAKKYKTVLSRYRQILKEASREEPPPELRPKGRAKKTKGRNLLERLERYEEEVLRFTREHEVPFTNNLAERDIRPLKTKLKVSGCFRTLQGARHYARIKSFCSTAKKHGLSAYEELLNAWRGESFLRSYAAAGTHT